MTSLPLLPLVKKYFEADPLSAAHSLEAMTEPEAVAVLKAIPPALAADALPHLQPSLAASLAQHLPANNFRAIIERLNPQQAATIFLHLPEEARPDFLKNLSEKSQREIRERLTYPEESAGRMMNKDFLAFHNDLKAKEAIQKIRTLVNQGTSIAYVYVIDSENRLIGVLNMRDLMLTSGENSLEAVMRKDVYSVNCFTDRETVAHDLSQRGFFAAPVVDAEGKLLGVVRAEDLLLDVQKEATEDIQKMFGAGGNETAFSPITYSLKKRLPWLHVNLITAFLAASVVAQFENLIARITILAVFLPVVAGQGGNAGTQSLAVVMRGLVMREIPPRLVKKLIFKEMGLGMLNGLAIGCVTALVAWLWYGNPVFGFVIGLAMIVNLTAAGLAGAGIPLAMKGMGLDPAQCSGIFLTTITDVVGFFSFLGFALIFQNYLL